MMDINKTTIHQLSDEAIFGLDESILETDTLSDSDASIVKKAFRKLSLRFHPDKDPSAEARVAFDRLKEAADTLTTPELFRQYVQEHKARQKVANQQQASERDTERFAEDLRRRQERHREQGKEPASPDRQRRQTTDGQRLAQAEAVESLRRSMMSSWSQIEADMVADWEVGAEELEAKERDICVLLNVDAEGNPLGNAAPTGVEAMLIGLKRARAGLATARQPAGERPQ